MLIEVNKSFLKQIKLTLHEYLVNTVYFYDFLSSRLSPNSGKINNKGS